MAWQSFNDVYIPKSGGGDIEGSLSVSGNLVVNDGSGNGTTYDVASEISDLKSAWDSVSPTVGTVGSATLIRLGKLCVLSIYGLQYTTSAFGFTSVGTLPSDCTPTQTTSAAISCSLGSTSALLTVYTNRRVMIESGSDAIDNEYVYGQVVFLTT